MRTVARVLAVLVLAAAGIGLSAAPVSAAQINVTTTDDELNADGDCSLREAIVAANTDGAVDACAAGSGADSIGVPAGTYTLTLGPAGDDVSATGDLDITGDLTIAGASRNTTIVDGNDLDRVFHVISGVVTMRHLVIQNGQLNGDGGAGIDSLANLTLDGVTVRSNEVTGNTGSDAGGGIRASDTLLIKDSVISDNDSFLGGGLLTFADTTVTDTTFLRNRADQGGGFENAFTSTTMTRVTFEGNEADIGGAILMLTTVTDDVLSIANSTISGNEALSDGGGIYNPSEVVNLTSVTITNNTADADGVGGGAGGGISNGVTGTVNLKNTIVAGNSDPSSDPDCFGTINSMGHNLIGNISAGCVFGATATDQIDIDPKLKALANNGGPTNTHALKAGSPARNQIPMGSAPNKDQRGAPRAGKRDIGAYEFVKCRGVVVNRVGTSGPDVLRGTGARDGVLGLGGADTIRAKAGNDGVCGGRGKDRLIGGGGNDKLDGDPGPDILKGGGGMDGLFGEAGNDKLFGGPANDALNGGAGTDRCRQGGGIGPSLNCEL